MLRWMSRVVEIKEMKSDVGLIYGEPRNEEAGNTFWVLTQSA